MGNLPKILKIVFIILIGITVFEIGYYFYILTKKVETTPPTSNTATISIPKIIEKPSSEALNQREVESAFKHIGARYLTTADLVTSFKGKIIQFIDNPKNLGGWAEWRDSVFAFVVDTGINNSKVVYPLSELDLKKVKVYRIEENNELSVDLKDLKVGDYVEVEEIKDLKKKWEENLKQLTIRIVQS